MPHQSSITSERRRTLFIVAALTLFGMTPVFGHHLAPRLSDLVTSNDHFVGICLIALHEMLQPVHEIFHVLLVGGLLYAGWDRARAWMRLRTTMAALTMRPPVRGDFFWDAAVSAGFPPSSIFVVSDLPPSAFTAGWVQPRIYVAESLSSVLNPVEGAAVIAHEAAHVRARDPLRLSSLRFLANTMFFVPTLRKLTSDLEDEAELAADDAAISESATHPLALAAALVVLAEYQAALALPAVGFHKADMLDCRVRRLAGERTVRGTHVTWRSLVLASLMLLLVWTSGLVAARPSMVDVRLDATHAGELSTEHCRHKHEWAFSHLFCDRGSHLPGDRCPHRAFANPTLHPLASVTR